MVKLKNQFKIINIYLFIFLGVLFIINNQKVMAMENNSKDKSKKDIDIIEETIDTLEENVKYFTKKRIQINLNKLTKLLSNNKKRNASAQNIASTSQPHKKKK
ncbi:SVM family protein [Candidatus Phytoplasma tritici]|uniref:SVM family protein n=1 Tax=Candidatus Phytoplasma tritici TaxID=321961 RepID=UPI00041CF5CB|nr:SVM family protein [Candidatus Phytoplasma tritici]